MSKELAVGTRGVDRIGIGDLPEWIEVVSEQCRGGRVLHTLVDAHRRQALAVDDTEIDGEGKFSGSVLAELEESGFLDGGQVEAEGTRPVGDRIRHFLRTLDVPLARADGLVRTLYQRGLRRCFTSLGVGVQVILAVAGLVAVVAEFGRDSHVQIRVGASQVPAFVALGAAAVVVHELAHAVVVTHYGRRIDVVGFRLHLGAPAFYVESVEALCLTRRQRLVQAAAGPWAEWVFTSVVALVVVAVPLDGTTHSILHRFLAINVFNVVANLLPFVGLDGALLLADGIRVPDLPDRSRGAAGRLVERVVSGGRPTVGEVGLAGYAAGNFAAAVVLVAISSVLWVGLFGDVIESLWTAGPLGVAALALAALVVARPVVAVVAPFALGLVVTARRLHRARRFRRSVPWRVAAMKEFRRTVPDVGALGAAELGVLAGRLRRVRGHADVPAGCYAAQVPAAGNTTRAITVLLRPSDLDGLTAVGLS